MKKLFEQYKDLVTGVIVAGGLMGSVLLLLAPIGTKVSGQVVMQDYEGYRDCDVLTESAAKPAPEIILKEDRQWKAGEVIIPEEAFAAKDCDGKQLAFTIKQILTSSGEDKTAMYNAQSKKAVLEEPGYYLFTLESMDSRKKKTVRKLPLIVDR